LFTVYKMTFPRINSKSESILIADDTSALTASRNFEDFCSVSHLVLSHRFKWCAPNKLVLNVDYTNILKFITKNSSHSTLYIGYKEEYIEEMEHTKFRSL
jgi:hypothetical protein